MTEPTPLFDQTHAALDGAQPVNSTVDGATAEATATAADDALNLPDGPDLADLQAFTDAIPDEGHRAIAQQLVDAFQVRDAQLQAFLGAYATARADLDAAMADIVTLQASVEALQPPAVDPVPDPAAP